MAAATPQLRISNRSGARRTTVAEGFPASADDILYIRAAKEVPMVQTESTPADVKDDNPGPLSHIKVIDLTAARASLPRAAADT